MKKRLAQISIEYIILFSFITVFIIGGLVMFREFAKGASESITEQRLNKIANFIIDNSREMYYLGAPSKTTLEVDMPEQILGAVILYSSIEKEYILIFVVDTAGTKAPFYFDSDVPLKVNDPETACDPKGDFGLGICDDADKCECFKSSFFSSGLKNIELKANLNDFSNPNDQCLSMSGTCVKIGLSGT